MKGLSVRARCLMYWLPVVLLLTNPGMAGGPAFPKRSSSSISSAWLTLHPKPEVGLVLKNESDGPTLRYSTYLGGDGLDQGSDIALDSASNIYIAGPTSSADLPVTPGTLQDNLSRDRGSSFIAKLDPTGSRIIYLTYLGSSYVQGIAVDADGNVYLTGYAGERFVTTPNAYQASFAGAGGAVDAFFAKLDPTGSTLLYSTYLGGSGDDRGFDISLGLDRSVYVVGQTTSTDLPTSRAAIQRAYGGGNLDGFVAKFDAMATGAESLIYSTYLGDKGNDKVLSIAIDAQGDAYVTGGTTSKKFPRTPGAFRVKGKGSFVTKIHRSGTEIAYSAMLGGIFSNAIAVDAAGNAYIAGEVFSDRFPTTPGAFQTARAGYGDVCVFKLNHAGTRLIYSTFIGGQANDAAWGLALDQAGHAYVIGNTESVNFPTVAAPQSANRGSWEAFVTRLSPDGSRLVYSTYLGGTAYDWGKGIAINSDGQVFGIGQTSSSDFPTINSLRTPGAGDLGEAFVISIQE